MFFRSEYNFKILKIIRRPGDCIDLASTDFCGTSIDTTCNIYTSARQLPQCNNQNADYFHAKTRCIPISSTKIKNFNICNDQQNDITDSNGLIRSPGFPTYSSVPNECTRRIVAPSDKVIKIWVSVDMKSAVSNE